MLLLSNSCLLLCWDIDLFKMLLFVLLLLVRASQAFHYYGATVTYYPKECRADGSVSVSCFSKHFIWFKLFLFLTQLRLQIQVILRYKLSFHSCDHTSPQTCFGNCEDLIQSLPPTKVDEISDVWCQTEGIDVRLLPDNWPLQVV